MSESILRTKSKEYAKSIVLLCRSLKENKVEYALIDQLLRSGTSIGANVHKHNMRKVRKISYQNLRLR